MTETSLLANYRKMQFQLMLMQLFFG
ncbi:hypothetical protein EE36_14213 [Sulfitobacter sp. EE-36]|nr:hypothetical protein EE36_14213 [Sulfitobacter sp. EE-36]